MSEHSDELSRTLAALRAQFEAIKHAPPSEEMRTAFEKSVLKLRNIIAHVSVLEADSHEGLKAQKSFVELCAQIDPLLYGQKKQGEFGRMTLSEAISVYSTRNTEQLVRYFPLVRDGLSALKSRQLECNREILLLLRRTPSEEVIALVRDLKKVSEILEELEVFLERMKLAERPEVVLLDNDDVVGGMQLRPISEFLEMIEGIRAIQFQQSQGLSRIEESIRRLKFQSADD